MSQDKKDPPMTLRDYFAAAYVAGRGGTLQPSTDFNVVARVAYKVADAMLKVRDEK